MERHVHIWKDIYYYTFVVTVSSQRDEKIVYYLDGLTFFLTTSAWDINRQRMLELYDFQMRKTNDGFMRGVIYF